ncbi:hypothetical protein BT63DRAFT_453754 [Microthyrium microscopicum]|uniref:SWIM-type domain-containing protein n=1 Tax=Microthyrium microscopicum TaxID=703497 RepID=A0A6A6UIS3_9PEZI|nr:hypothetical protein BT63DRAFT_453754 [Microthyrium microscopicum]
MSDDLKCFGPPAHLVRIMWRATPPRLEQHCRMILNPRRILDIPVLQGVRPGRDRSLTIRLIYFSPPGHEVIHLTVTPQNISCDCGEHQSRTACAHSLWLADIAATYMVGVDQSENIRETEISENARDITVLGRNSALICRFATPEVLENAEEFAEFIKTTLIRQKIFLILNPAPFHTDGTDKVTDRVYRSILQPLTLSLTHAIDEKKVWDMAFQNLGLYVSTRAKVGRPEVLIELAKSFEPVLMEHILFAQPTGKLTRLGILTILQAFRHIVSAIQHLRDGAKTRFWESVLSGSGMWFALDIFETLREFIPDHEDWVEPLSLWREILDDIGQHIQENISINISRTCVKNGYKAVNGEREGRFNGKKDEDLFGVDDVGGMDKVLL